MDRTKNRFPLRLPGAGWSIAIALCVLSFVLYTFGESALLSEIEIKASSRGVIISLDADNPFSALFSTRETAAAGTSVVTITLAHCVYGLPYKEYTGLGQSAPVKQISVQTSKDAVILKITASQIIDGQTILARQRGNRWIAILSSKPGFDFSFRASEYIPPASATPVVVNPPAKPAVVSHAKTESADTVAPKQDKIIKPTNETLTKSVTPPSPTKTAVENVSTIRSPATVDKNGPRVIGVSALQRESVERLIFQCSSEPRVLIKREDGKLLVLFMNMINSLEKNSFSISDSGTYRNLDFKLVDHNGAPWLLATVTLSPRNQKVFAVERCEDHIVLSTTNRTRAIRIWRAKQGEALDFTFIDVPQLGIDYNSIGQKAAVDANRDLSESRTFAITESVKAPLMASKKEVASEKPGAMLPSTSGTEPAQKSVASNQSLPASLPVGKNKPTLETAKMAAPPALPAPVAKSSIVPAKPAAKRLLVIKDRVNLRSNPSNVSNDNIITRLPFGTMATQIESTPDWIKLNAAGVNGWVSAQMVKESASVSAELWNKISRSQPEPANPGNMQDELGETLPRGPVPHNVDEAEVAQAAQRATRADSAAAIGDSIVKGKAAAVAKKALEPVTYHVLGRDPFMPLTRDGQNNYKSPKVENLMLVGILYDQLDRIALFEDFIHSGQSYALREKDPVEKGMVLRINKDSVVFLIEEMGISRSYTLKLKKNDPEQK